jgi:methylase of polypeptide subunit release factors
MEQWNEPTFARQWAEENIDNPGRARVIGLLIKIMKDYLEATGMPHRILDVGCGHGVIAAHTLDELPNATLVGVDGSAPMLATVKRGSDPYTGPSIRR